MNSVNLVTNSSSLNTSSRKTSIEKVDDFMKLFEVEDYDIILEKALDTMSDLEKEAHLKTLENLEKEGYSQEQLNTVNMYAVLKNENRLFEINLSKEDEQVINSYESMFDKIYDAIKSKREERLALKPFQMQQMMTDTILKSHDVKEGKVSIEHSLNLEV